MLHRVSAATSANLHVHRTCTHSKIPGRIQFVVHYRVLSSVAAELMFGETKRRALPNRQSCPCHVDPVHVAAMRHGKRSLDMGTAEWF